MVINKRYCAVFNGEASDVMIRLTQADGNTDDVLFPAGFMADFENIKQITLMDGSELSVNIKVLQSNNIKY